MSMRIDVWSDVVCPWCFIGKRRLERALAGFAHADEVEVVYHSFLLDPDAPQEPVESVAESLGRKYGGGPDAGRAMVAQVGSVAAEEGLDFRLAEAQRASTVDAHRLLHLALAEHGPAVQRALKEELLSAYFLRAENPAAADVLLAAAQRAGVDEDRAREVLAGTEFREQVFDDVDRAADLGASGVPFFVLDQRYAVSGAQPAETFARALEQAWADGHPVLQPVGAPGDDSASGAVCGPEGCTP
ncbi:DSBA oxidoreductase [Marmoricola endophyticus]|uniref:DSBA oxidoreductase n=1 Tax=Marmoricola endophyticus TaxID=2040280 RepID=A0A917BFE7_9ACTN|nr:DsbA family oxidoreductase [Marmoricola endophyticus]GGF39582.1 DSBA oxidoreductase [Marmoricola endophyticus]